MQPNAYTINNSITDSNSKPIHDVKCFSFIQSDAVNEPFCNHVTDTLTNWHSVAISISVYVVLAITESDLKSD
jgi:hypothetical protein